MRRYLLPLLVVAGIVLSGCVVEPARPVRRVIQPAAPPPEQVTEVIAYPSQGQTPEQLDRDRYECHSWAVKQTGFDPSVPGTPPHQRVVVQGPPPPPPGSGVTVGAITGAVLGAIIAGPRDAGAGAAIGAIAGGGLGAASEAQQREAARDAEDRAIERANARPPGQEQRAGAYRRALTACLEGRGYSVK